MVGGIITSFIMELTVYPAIFYALKKREVNKMLSAGNQTIIENENS
jgi:Cu(I)/Ag(I) efflux system membrane protein CusA/SilA